MLQGQQEVQVKAAKASPAVGNISKSNGQGLYSGLSGLSDWER